MLVFVERIEFPTQCSQRLEWADVKEKSPEGEAAMATLIGQDIELLAARNTNYYPLAAASTLSWKIHRAWNYCWICQEYSWCNLTDF